MPSMTETPDAAAASTQALTMHEIYRPKERMPDAVSCYYLLAGSSLAVERIAT